VETGMIEELTALMQQLVLNPFFIRRRTEGTLMKHRNPSSNHPRNDQSCPYQRTSLLKTKSISISRKHCFSKSLYSCGLSRMY
jgi:hypothetical protein